MQYVGADGTVYAQLDVPNRTDRSQASRKQTTFDQPHNEFSEYAEIDHTVKSAPSLPTKRKNK